MAIANDGPGGFHRGRLGNVLYYTLNGKNVSRTIGVYKDRDTEKQRDARLRTKLCSNFFQHIHDFINVGYSVESPNAAYNPFNLAVTANKPNMFSGSYPNLQIEYDLLILSKGNLTPAQNPQVVETGTGLEFTWDTDKKMAFPMATDQVMVLAYFPKKKKAFYTLFGTDRLSGKASLQIPASLRGQYMETYISFSSADRTSIADSTYTGSFNKS
ncbi:MAG: DUF6266 family protein [Pedobacter sp.]|uniref:DUF6266 family protein n=1 Tax=Pedobacter sp. TaxID=1411316 RepID=UPI003561B1DB